MGRVIKNASTSDMPYVLGDRIIDKEVFEAEQVSQQTAQRTQEEIEQMKDQGKRSMAQAKEEAIAQAAQAVFKNLAHLTLGVFMDRSERLHQISEDIRFLGLEIAQKIGGPGVSFEAKEIEDALMQSMVKLTQARQFSLQVSPDRKAIVAESLSHLFAQLPYPPVFRIEETKDLKSAQMRVTSDAGSFLSEESLLFEDFSLSNGSS